MGGGFGHVPVYKVFCHILEPEQMDCREKVHLLGMHGALESKMPSEIFICHRCCPVDRAFMMDEEGALSLRAWAGLPRWLEFQILQVFSCCFSTFHLL